jgi:hypothetical protein
MQIIVLSNNPAVWETFSGEIVKIEGGPCDVFKEARNMAHRGYILFSHPVHGNMRLLRNPYRTVIFKKDRNYNEVPSLGSIMFLEDSLARLQRQDFDLSEGSLADYSYIDRDLFEKTISENS